MNRDETIQEVADRLGNRTNLNSKILRNLSYVQRFVCERYPILPWFLITENLFATTTINEPKLQVPTGFLREVENGALWRQRTPDETSGKPWVELEKQPHDKLRSALGNELKTPGPPTHYAILGEYWILAPVPDKEYTIYTRCYQRDLMASEFSSGGETNGWMSHEWELLVAETVLRTARHLQWEQAIMREFRSDRDEAKRNFFVNEEARTNANLHYRMGIARGN